LLHVPELQIEASSNHLSHFALETETARLSETVVNQPIITSSPKYENKIRNVEDIKKMLQSVSQLVSYGSKTSWKETT